MVIVITALTVHCPGECRSLVRSPDVSRSCSGRGRGCRRMEECETTCRPWEPPSPTLMSPSLPTFYTTRWSVSATKQTNARQQRARLPSAVSTATPAFHVWSSGLFCSRPSSLELVTRLPARSVTFLLEFLPRPETFLFSLY